MHYHNKPLSILHITNDFTGSKVYKSLFSELDKLGVKQTVYTAIRDPKKIGNNEIAFNCKDSRIIYSHILNKYIDRLAYPIKILKIFKDLQSRVDLDSIDYIHAHTWYSDGGVAYLLSKKYNIPFMIAIRSTDVDLFHKSMIYLHPFGKRILNRADNIVLITASYRKKLLQYKSIKKIIELKAELIPNGVDSFWIKNHKEPSITKTPSKGYNLLYIGTFIPRKNLIKLQKAVINLNKKYDFNIVLNIVGGGGGDESEVLKIVKKHPNSFKYHGKVNDKKRLLSIMRSCDAFTMTSIHETFGLVYIESLLQSLPLLFTEDEGIDGLYSENIGEKVHKPNEKNIENKLYELVINLDRGKYSIPIDKIQKNHDWALIAKKYLHIYSLKI